MSYASQKLLMGRNGVLGRFFLASRILEGMFEGITVMI